jgi:hypothetical protein
MDTESLLSIKLLPECKNFDKDILNNINSFFKKSNIKYVKKNKKLSNVLKNSNFNLKKNETSNKMIFILNKLSENNIDNIMIEFIENIKIDNEKNFEIIQNIIFEKIIKDNKFINVYCDLLIKIIKYTYKKYNYKPNYLLSIIDSFINNYNIKNENDRLIFLNFLTIMIKNNFFNSNIINVISQKLVELKLISDLKFWFNYYNLDKSVLLNFKINNTRDRLIYESIFEDKKNISINKQINIQQNTNKNTFLTQCQNIIEEYELLNLNEEIKYFIENECKNDNMKSEFIEYIINQYVNKKKNNMFNLFEFIINNNIIKTNIIKKILKNESNNYEIKNLISCLKKNNVDITI